MGGRRGFKYPRKSLGTAFGHASCGEGIGCSIVNGEGDARIPSPRLAKGVNAVRYSCIGKGWEKE